MKNFCHKPANKTLTQKLLHLFATSICLAIIFVLTPMTAQAITTTEQENERLMLGSLCECVVATDDAICHIPTGSSDNEHTIHVGAAAVRAHLAHGDTLGACPGDIEEITTSAIEDRLDGSCTCADGSAGNWYHSSPILSQDSSLRQAYAR